MGGKCEVDTRQSEKESTAGYTPLASKVLSANLTDEILVKSTLKVNTSATPPSVGRKFLS